MIIEKKSPYKFNTLLFRIETGAVFRHPELDDYFMKTDTIEGAVSIITVSISNGRITHFHEATKVCPIHAKVVIE